MNIEFYDSNYDSILEARWYADDKSYLLADITVNGVIYDSVGAVSYTHLRAHETREDLV